MGLEGSEILMEGSLLGSKVVLNEFIAFQELGSMKKSLDPRKADLCHLTLRFCEFFQSWHLCFRYSGSLPGEKKHTCKARIPGDAGRGAGKPAERYACWFCNTFLRRDCLWVIKSTNVFLPL